MYDLSFGKRVDLFYGSRLMVRVHWKELVFCCWRECTVNVISNWLIVVFSSSASYLVFLSSLVTEGTVEIPDMTVGLPFLLLIPALCILSSVTGVFTYLPLLLLLV